MKQPQIGMLSLLQTQYPDKTLLTSKNISEILDVSLGTVNNLVKAQKIPYLKFGDAKSSTIRFDIVSIARWLEIQNSNKERDDE